MIVGSIKSKNLSCALETKTDAAMQVWGNSNSKTSSNSNDRNNIYNQNNHKLRIITMGHQMRGLTVVPANTPDGQEPENCNFHHIQGPQVALPISSSLEMAHMLCVESSGFRILILG